MLNNLINSTSEIGRHFSERDYDDLVKAKDIDAMWVKMKFLEAENEELKRENKLLMDMMK